MKTFFLVTLLLAIGFTTSQAQKPKTVEEYNNRGLEKQGKGELDGAIEDYTASRRA